jgi:hypothetical protein
MQEKGDLSKIEILEVFKSPLQESIRHHRGSSSAFHKRLKFRGIVQAN